VRVGDNPYEFITVGDCHYNYPPLLALALVPLADRPAWIKGGPAVPFEWSVALWYAFGLLSMAWGVHRLASALEATSPDPAVRGQLPGCRRWWYLRVLPALVCLPGIVRTLALGQVDLLILALLCATAAAALRGRSWSAGLWLSGAVCVKLIPAFLLVYPLWRRDWRWLAGCAAGVAVGWVAVPAAVWGPARAWAYQRQWAEAVVLPGLGGADSSRDSDLTSLTRVNSQSLVAILHNFRHPDRARRPARPDPWARALALLAVAALTALTLAKAGRAASAPATATALGALLAVMLLASPVCHPHYFCHWVPLTVGLLAWDMERRGNLEVGRPLLWVFALSALANVLTSIPGLAALRDGGLATASGVLLWWAGFRALGRWAAPGPDARRLPSQTIGPLRFALGAADAARSHGRRADASRENEATASAE
jgi:hypothetical protein